MLKYNLLLIPIMSIGLNAQSDTETSSPKWGEIEWTSMAGAFAGCANLVGNARDVPDLSKVENMEYMFLGASNFNQNISNWNVKNVNNMLCIFGAMGAFNQDISKWNVSGVINMSNMFANDSAFNQDISSWNVSNVQVMDGMFYKAISFNQDLERWNVNVEGNITDTNGMFNEATALETIPTWYNE